MGIHLQVQHKQLADNNINNHKTKINWAVSILFVMLLSFISMGNAHAQIRDRINQIKTADPFAISGSVGTGLGLSYNSNQPGSTPFSANLYASLNLSFYSFELPISFYLNNNTTSFSYPQLPTFHLGFMPTWRNWKFHIGNSSMHFSNYTYSGLTFTGLGVEYQGKLFRMSTFGGHLQHASRIKGYDDRSAFQQLADSLLGLNVPEADLPQYRTDGGGFKVGVGNERNFIDFSFLKAKDAIKSLPEVWWDSIAPRENLALGLSGRFAIRNWFSFTANLGASVFTSNTLDSLGTLVNDRMGVAKFTKYTNWLMPVCNNTTFRLAGDAAMNFFAKGFTGSVTYRFIQPDYASLGASNFNQNSHSLGIVLNSTLFKGRSNISAIGYIQRDNLNKKQMYMNQVATYSLNWNNHIGQIFNLGINYSGIKQDQFNGTCIVADSLKVNQMTHTLAVTPSFSFDRTYSHTIGLNFNLIQNLNLNKNNPNGVNVQTITAGANYSIDMEAIRLGIDAGYDYAISKSEYSNYNAHELNLGLRYKIMKKEKLNWTVNYNGAFAYNIQKDEGAKNNVSISNSLGSNFSFNQAHTASLYFSISNFSDREIIGQRVQTDLDCRFTFSYSYSFAARVIKKMTKDERAKARLTKEADKLMKKQIKANK